ncbi:phosphotriesterase-related protein [Sphingobium sufflavum]|uniref:phosphotriesterase family protein n=1 Tax=Sphingobium sufflavum TaxID=1129547 RepID=UPI001F2577BD|nr:phosphotriesterase-related protein [Sphingobium sufflavum]MCE7796428.1 phosphotriesterase-related protein [Sphingobium sufflavum]
MTIIQTVTGPIDADSLGRVLIHEHVFTGDIEHLLNHGRDFDEDAEIARAAAKMNAIKASGIDTIIDLTVLGLGRYVPRIRKVAELTDLNIIVSTGCYTLDVVPMPFQMVGPGLLFDEEDPMPGLFAGDIEHGIMDTGIRAAEVKCAIDAAGLTPGVERVMRAVAKANVRTGAPITVHTNPANGSGLIAQNVFAEEGVDLRDVIIGHLGDTMDLDYLTALAERGSILGMDRFGIAFSLSFEQRIATIVAMIERGFVEHLALSHDCYCWTNFHPGGVARFHEHQYSAVTDHVVPALRAAGVSQSAIDIMLIGNPHRHFVGAASRFAARNRSTHPADGVV